MTYKSKDQVIIAYFLGREAIIRPLVHEVNFDSDKHHWLHLYYPNSQRDFTIDRRYIFHHSDGLYELLMSWKAYKKPIIMG